jgi:uncharacterized protein (DUF2267 family)
VNYDELIKQIERAGEFPDPEHARDAADAVLSVLGDHLVGGSPRNLAAQLPPEIADALPPEGGGQGFDMEQFDFRVAEREGRRCTPAQAHHHAVAVMTTILAAVTPGEARKVAGQLPAEYLDLLPPDIGS